jgi:hypothetical protein
LVPDCDLSVFPIVPPIDPAWANTLAVTTDISITDKIAAVIKRLTEFAIAMSCPLHRINRKQDNRSTPLVLRRCKEA